MFKNPSQMSLKWKCLIAKQYLKRSFAVFPKKTVVYALWLKLSGKTERQRLNREWAVMGSCDATGLRMMCQQKGFAFKKLQKHETAICCLNPLIHQSTSVSPLHLHDILLFLTFKWKKIPIYSSNVIYQSIK